LLRYVTRNGHTSFVISPFSIAITLSILSYGAVGNTQAQIDKLIANAESDSYIDTIANQANTRPQSKILVFNAVWMWAEWIKKFKNEETFLKDFYVNQDEIKRVNMMPIWAYGTYRYGENADLQVVGIPFSDEETYMYIFLTRDRYAVLNDFIKDMDYQRIIALINRCKIVDVEVGHYLT
uniref:LP15633p (inferred by orthology to a D. melanogaster protein) n=1 Tax=Anisakis simplex TaxID=6269 RepID=A0A0M3KFM0_ANISI